MPGRLHPRRQLSPARDLDALVGRALRASRLARGITLADLALRLRVQPGRLASVEAGYSRPSAALLVRAADLLEIPISSLFT